MAPTTFTLVSLGSYSDRSLLDELKASPLKDQLLWLGKCHHWIHQPRLSTAALNGTGARIQQWDFLIVTRTPKQPALSTSTVDKTWSVTAEVPDDNLASFTKAQARRGTAVAASLPQGWSPQDHSGLDATVAPLDMEASVAMTSRAMGSASDSEPVVLKDFIRDFGSTNPGPVAMFNLLSYLPSQRPRYMQYVAAFQESVGIKYGGEPIFIGFGVLDWSSRKTEEEAKQEGGWEDSALIYYPSLWHFGKMFDDEAYMDVDRKFKQGVLRDNPLIMCTEVKTE